MTKLRAVFWDVDGTIAETEMDGHRVAFNESFNEFKLGWDWNESTYANLLSIPGGIARIQFYSEEENDSLGNIYNIDKNKLLLLIFDSKKIIVDKYDTPKKLEEKIHKLEYEYFPKVIESLLK